MSTSPGVVSAVRWTELCPWLLLVRAARVALLLRVIVLAALGVIVTQAGWSAIEGMFLDESPDVHMVRLTERPAPWLGGVSELPSSGSLFDQVDAQRYSGPLLRGWAWAMQPLTWLVEARTLGWRLITALLLAGAWVIAVWALIGGAIARIAAVWLARGESLGPLVALRAAAGKWISMFSAPVFCFGIIALFALVLAFVGLVIRFELFAFLAGIVWPLVLLMGAAVAVFAIGLMAGWPFMLSTVAAEQTDAFDGVSRGYAFTFQRPLHLVFYLIVATVLGLLAQAAVSLVVESSLTATNWAVTRGAGSAYGDVLLHGVAPPKDEPLTMLGRAGGKMIRFWSSGLAALASSFPMAYLWPAAMGIYLLMRRLIDSTELGEVAVDESPPAQGLPPLINDGATGVPSVQLSAAEPSATVSGLRGDAS